MEENDIKLTTLWPDGEAIEGLDGITGGTETGMSTETIISQYSLK